MARFKFGKKKDNESTNNQSTTSSVLNSPTLNKKRISRIRSFSSGNKHNIQAAPGVLNSPPKSLDQQGGPTIASAPTAAAPAALATTNKQTHTFTDDELNDTGTDDQFSNEYNANNSHPQPLEPHHQRGSKAMPLILEPLGYDAHGNGLGIATQSIPYKSRPPPNLNTTNPWNRFKIFDSPFPRYRHAASSITSEKNEIFIMGGLKEGSVFGDTWKITPHESSHGDVLNYTAENIEIVNNNNPPARVGHSSVLCGNAFIIYGGDTVETDEQGFPDNNFYLFNINNNKYTIPSHILNKPNGRYGHTLGVISMSNNSSRLYLFGGQLENDVFNDLFFFELNSFKSPKASWTLVAPLNNFKPPPLTNHSMSVYKNKIYIFGGVYNNERVSNDLWVFDADEERWTQVETTGTVPLPVNEHSSCIVNDKLYIYGGNDFSGVIYSSLYVLDLNTLVWFKLKEAAEENGPGPRCGHSMTFLPKYNKLVIMGGDKNDYIVSDPHNFDTYETFNGEEIGTMIYELDVAIVDHFMSEPVEQGGRKPKKAAASAAPKSESEFGARYDRQHARSYSAGPEDYATPQGSPSPPLAATERVKLNRNISTRTDGNGNANDFVEVDLPSGAISHVDQEDLANPYINTSFTPNDTPDIGKAINGKFNDTTIDDEEPQAQTEAGTKKANANARNNVDEEDDYILRRRSLDPKFGQEDNIESAGSTSGAGVAAAFAAAGAAGTAAGHADAMGLGLDTTDVDTLDQSPAIPNRSSFVDNSYEKDSHYPDEEDQDREVQDDSHYDEQNSTYLHESSYTEPLATRGFGATRDDRTSRLAGSASKNGSENDGKVKKIINELTNELVQLKQSTKQQMQSATEKITQLEQQHTNAQATHRREIENYTQQLNDKDAMINELKASLDPSAWNPDVPAANTNLSELSRYKLERLELNNKLVYLEQENENLRVRFAEFEPFMNNQIGELDKFQKVIKVQEEQIDKLSHQVKDQEALNKEINELRLRYDNLSLEFENYKAIHNDDQISIEEGAEERDLNDVENPANLNGSQSVDNRSIFSSAKSRKDISTQLETLVQIWNSKQSQSSSTKEASPVITPENNPVVARLQQQVDDLLRIGKQNDETSHMEIDNLRKELEAKLASLKNLEDNYKESLQSVNNTSKALKLNQDELNNQRQLLEKLIKENNELKMFKKAAASRRFNSPRDGTPITPTMNEPNDGVFATPTNGTPVTGLQQGEDEDDDEEVISNAHFNMKIKDLEADLYILKQERDQLKDNVTSLQKQLYLANNQ